MGFGVARLEKPAALGAPSPRTGVRSGGSTSHKGGQRRPRAARFRPLTAILRIVAAQFGVGLAVVLAALLVSGQVAALSALMGSLACALPNAVLGIRISAASASGDAQRMLRATYVAVALKLLMTAALFAVVFALVRPLAAGWLFAGFILTQATMWVAPALAGDEPVSRGARASR